ncbi:MAG: HD-GYP domain-containing protein, partial [Burkholderiaceae bacterium]
LRRVVACGLPITIDTSKGCDVREVREAPRCEAVATVVGATVVGAAVVGAAAVGDAAAGAAAAGDAVIGDTPAGAAGRQREPAGPPVSSGASALSEASVPSAASAQPKGSARAPAASLADERRRARSLVKESFQYVRALHDEVRLGNVAQLVHARDLVGDIGASLTRHPSALMSLLRLKTTDDYTYLHSVSVCALMVALARERRMDEERCLDAGIAGLLHDIGKARVPLAVLNKPGKLTDAEFDLMRQHPRWGCELIEKAGFDHETARDVALHHHERIDGTGYPSRLAGERISIMARMGAICDVYDAVTSQRCYKDAWEPAVALRRMASWDGHFDKVVFQAFVKVVGIYPVGSLVRLRSKRLGVVIGQSGGSLLTPMVRVFYSLRENMPIAEYTLRLDQPKVDDEIVAIESPESWGFTQLERLLD